MKKISYSEAKNNYKLIDDSNMRVFWDYWTEANKDFSFLLYDGDTVLDNLNLDNENYDNDIIGILVNGNLEVNNIYNFESDYGVHLVVLGDVSAKNIIVAGQDININGNLNVAEVFLGFYNHGSIFVGGDILSPTIIILDYGFVTFGKATGTVYGNECIYYSNNTDAPVTSLLCPNPGSNLEDIFDDSVFEVTEIDFKKIAQRAERNQPILSVYLFDEKDEINPSDVKKWLHHSKVTANTTKLKKWEMNITIVKSPTFEWILSEYGTTYKLILESDNVTIYFNGEKNHDLQIAQKGCVEYRKFKRIFENKTNNIEWYFE
ncbi:hypothetical protein GOQ04_20625 [Emticicia sp. ODNR4P]|nr:hypothetical protein [Emticicia sp. ODNR4P]